MNESEIIVHPSVAPGPSGRRHSRPANTRVGRVTVALVAAVTAVAVVVTVVGAPVEAAFQFSRWSGTNRFSTSVAVSQQAFPDGADTVVIASGAAFPDALAAGSLAGRRGGAILLTQPTVLPPAIATELTRLQPVEVLVVGGPSAVSPAVLAAIEGATGVEPTRLAGPTRYETAAAIVPFGFSDADTVYVVSGSSFPDALAAGAPGGRAGRPVLLATQTALPAATADAIAALSDPDVIVVGGPGAVTDAVLEQIDQETAGVVRRVSGLNRFLTSVAVSVDSFPSADTVFLASGLIFPDALSAAPAAAAANAPVLLTQTTCVPEAVMSEIYRLGATRIVTIGGAGVIDHNVANLVPCGPPDTPLFSFLAQSIGRYARWDPCDNPIGYQIDTRAGTQEEWDAIDDAVATVAAATGMTFQFVGYENAGGRLPGADAVIGYRTEFEANVIGQGGVLALGGEVLTGQAWVLAGLPPAQRRHTLIHEIGHLMNLGHAEDLGQVMAPVLPMVPFTDYAAGDLEGLRLLGATMPCLAQAPLVREAPVEVTWVDTAS